MEFIGEKSGLSKSAKVFGTIGGFIAAAGIAFIIMTRFSNILVEAIIAIITGIAIGITYSCVRFILRGSVPRVVIDDEMMFKEDIRKEKIPLAHIRKLEKRREDLVIHLERRKVIISAAMGYPVNEISRYLQKRLKGKLKHPK